MFDPFGDFATEGYLRNFDKEKDPDIDGIDVQPDASSGYTDPNTEKEYLAFERKRGYRFGTNQQVKSVFDASLGEFDELYKKLAE